MTPKVREIEHPIDAAEQVIGGNVCVEVERMKQSIGRQQSGERPVLILSQDVFNERSGTVIAMALTSQEQRAGFPLTHEIRKSKLPKRSWVMISQIRTLSTERIGRKIGSIDPEELDHVIEGLNEIVSS